jgi:hypothetical protein
VRKDCQSSSDILSELKIFQLEFCLSDANSTVCHYGNENINRLPCLHAFHIDCAKPWFKDNTCCPVCRLELHPTRPHPKLRFRIDELAGLTIKELK